MCTIELHGKEGIVVYLSLSLSCLCYQLLTITNLLSSIFHSAGKGIKLESVDTPPRTVVGYMEDRTWFRDAQALVFVFDLSRKGTLNCFDEFKTKFAKIAGSGMSIIVIGNKSDLTREVSIEEIADWRKDKAVEVRHYFDVLSFTLLFTIM
jgi:hypothetical protein